MANNLNEITVISPDGVAGTIPLDNLEEALKPENGYTLPAPKAIEPLASDLVGKDEVKILDPDGNEGTIPKANLDEALKNNYKLPSQNSKTKEDMDLIHVFPYAGAKVIKQHESDKPTDKDGNLLLLAPNGESVTMPPDADKLVTKLQEGFKFKDSNFQNNIEAQLQNFKDHPVSSKLFQGVLSTDNGVTFGLTQNVLKDKIQDSETSNIDRARLIAQEWYRKTEGSTADTIGNVVGSVLPILATDGVGLLGEGAAGAKAAGTVERLVAGEAPGAIRSILARGAGGAVEGAIVTAPQNAVQALIDKDPAGAAENMAIASGLGATIGLGTKAFQEASRALSGGVKNAVTDAALREVGANEETLGSIGSTEQKQQLLSALNKTGITAESKAPEIESAVTKLASGEHAAETYAKLDAVVAKDAELQAQLHSNHLIGKIEQIAQELNVSEEAKNILKPLLSKIDAEGNVTLSNVSRFAQDLAADTNFTSNTSDALNIFKKQAWKSAVQDLDAAGDIIVDKAGNVKLASEWSNQKFIGDIAKQLHQQTANGEAVSKATSPAMDWIKNFIEHKVVDGVSRVVSTGIGLAGGHPVAGWFAKPLVKPFVKKLLGSYLENSETKIPGFLKSKLEHPMLGSFLLADSVHAMDNKLSEIPSVLRSFSEKTAANLPNVIKNTLGKDANGLTKEQQFHKISDQLSYIASDPTVLKNHLAEASAPFDSHPAAAKLYQDALAKKIVAMYTALPKNPNPPQAFQKAEKWNPTSSQLHDFNQTLAVINNPMYLLHAAKQGTITQQQVETAEHISPITLGKMRQQIVEQAYSGKVDLSYQHRLSLSTLLGKPLDPSLGNMNQIQSSYANQAQPQSPQPKAKRSGRTLDSKNLPAAQGTLAQRLGK